MMGVIVEVSVYFIIVNFGLLYFLQSSKITIIRLEGNIFYGFNEVLLTLDFD